MFLINIRLKNKAAIKNGGTLESVPGRHNTPKTRDKVVDNYPHTLEFVPECYKTQEMCDKAVDNYPSTIQYVLDCCKIQEVYDKAINNCPFLFDSLFMIVISKNYKE